MIGATLGHYKIVAKLGQGGMGEVYRAEDTKLKRQVALKVLSSDLAENADRMARFQREAETVAALSHPNIVTIFSVEEADGRHFLTMELVDGKSLDELIPEAGLSLERVFELAIPLADALATAHERGIIHRDLKPANVMVNTEGRVKILDFGLAKLQETVDEAGADDATQALTREGMVMGTVPYMSPEQVQGRPADRRSDIFSLGVMLYEMVLGRRPFSGDSSAELISAILRDSPPSVSEVKTELPYHLGRIVRRCLEKDPKRRYQSALDVRNELEALDKEVDAGAVHTETAVLTSAPHPVLAPRPRWWLVVAGAAALALLLGVVGWQLWDRGPASPPRTPALAADDGLDRPSVAVLFFDNLSGDEELEWLRNGLTDMLVTDLSQSPDLRVLSTDRLYQILSDMRKLDERITSFEVVNEVAERAGAAKVVLGTFAKLGDTIRISIKIQEAATGEILRAESVDAQQQEDIFRRVDQLSRTIRSSVELPERPVVADDRNLEDVSTNSLAAYRAYAEAERLHYETRETEAIAFYRKAVEEDPSFAMAWAKLSTAHGNLQMAEESRRYAEKAMEHLDRLTEPERAYVEGRYFSQRLETVGRSIDTYRTTLERYPHLTALANNLGVLYSGLWMLDEAAAAFEQALAYGDVFSGTRHGLANVYAGQGDLDKAMEVLQRQVEREPDSFSTYSVIAGLELIRGDSTAARAALAKADELRPGWIGSLISHFMVEVFEDNFEKADEWAERVGELPFPFAQASENSFKANLHMHRGRSAEAVELARAAIGSYPEPGPSRAQTLLQVGLLQLILGDATGAIERFDAAGEEDPGNVTDYIAQALLAAAHQELGQERRADLVADELARRMEGIPGPLGDFLVSETRGRLALARDQPDEAIAQLERARRLPPSVDLNLPRVRYVLGEAYLAAERYDAAERIFREIVEDRDGQRIFQPIAWVRSHYQLARLLERRGDAAGARRHYDEFVERWGDGDLDAAELERARAFLARSAES